MSRVALITGITGQDGSYLTELLLGKGYKVHGIIRRHSTPCTDRIDHLLGDKQYKDRLFLHYGDLTDTSCLSNIINTYKPDEVYNLAAQSHVGISFEELDLHSAELVRSLLLRSIFQKTKWEKELVILDSAWSSDQRLLPGLVLPFLKILE